MGKPMDIRHLWAAADRLRARLLELRNESGFWEGELSSSPLATAVACFALQCVDSETYAAVIRRGLHWICKTQNPDGGWGDTDGKDPSNLSTSLLCRAALLAVDPDEFAAPIEKVNRWLETTVGSLDSNEIISKVYAAYGKDRTFAVPILTMNALAGVFPEGRAIWKRIDPLPFELAALPRSLFRLLNLKVVSYALPALIAIGQVRFHFYPSRNPLVAAIRTLSLSRTRKRVQEMQPPGGGFLEAVPLTGFVTMSLASMGLKEHPVVQKGVEFLLKSVRADGSWPIDTNLAMWVTTHAVKAIGGFLPDDKKALLDWILNQQCKTTHPFTGAGPGGWGWTDLPGSVPDADDTAGALAALEVLCDDKEAVLPAAKNGIHWLLNLQNSDGGFPTFCKGWGRFAFDRSCADITAHIVQVFSKWRPHVEAGLQQRMLKSMAAALDYLARRQDEAGCFDSLWFGHPENKPKLDNPVFDTARVILAIADIDLREHAAMARMIQKALSFLLSRQNADGGWSAGRRLPSSIEETAAAVQAVAAAGRNAADRGALEESLNQGLGWLQDHCEAIESLDAGPIGLYFAKLWYYEKYYPLIFSLQAFVSALGYYQKR